MKICRQATYSVAVLFVAALSQTALGQNATPPPGYFDIPAGFDFPADKRLLEQYRAQPNVAAQRIHAWNIFAGMTRPTPDNKFAIFETWFSEDETFAAGASNLRGRGATMAMPRFSVPRQFGELRGAEDVAAEPGSAVLSFVLYNFAGYNHVRTNRLFQTSMLDNLVKTGAFDVKIPQNRMIPPFPSNAVVLKTVWWPVAKDKISAMPIWDPDANPANPTGNPKEGWARFVGVDATRRVPSGETADITYAGQIKHGSHIVGLGNFHFIKLTAEMAAGVNSNGLLAAVAQASFGRQVAADDYAVLAAIHVTTKEIDDWVWATFWWHDRPNDGPFAQNRVGSLIGPWRNYLMDVTYDLNLPAEKDGSPKVAFDPWLEARFSDGGHGGGGTVSNCMNCHNRASWPERTDCPIQQGVGLACFLPIYRGSPDFEDTAYAPGRLRTDFLWSIPDKAK